jgi:hypothetical protein
MLRTRVPGSSGFFYPWIRIQDSGWKKYPYPGWKKIPIPDPRSGTSVKHFGLYFRELISNLSSKLKYFVNSALRIRIRDGKSRSEMEKSISGMEGSGINILDP